VSSFCRLLGATFLIVFALVAFTPLVGALSPRPVPLVPADAAVVLAGSVSADGALSDSSLRRAVQGIRLYKKGLVPLLVLSGGGGSRGSREAEIRAELAREMGVPQSAIMLLTNASTTREEAAKAAGLLLSRGTRHVLVVTDPLHMARARVAFAAEGFEVEAAPTSLPRISQSPGGRLRLGRALTEEWLATLLYRASHVFQRRTM
jgi:uncharacterized SAM-binding protein YcdF (DUF218 family)